MIAILKYDLPNEQYDFECAYYGHLFRHALSDMRERVRGRLKYGKDISPTEAQFLTDLQQELAEACEVEVP